MNKLIILLGLALLTVGCNSIDKVSPTNDNYKDGEVEFSEETSVSEDVYEEEKGVYMSLDQDKAYELIQNEDVIIIDVRTEQEYAGGHLKDSNLLPVDVITDQVIGQFPDKSALYLVYCRSGNRSQVAVNAMVELGYTQVFDIGGINTWPYEIVND